MKRTFQILLLLGIVAIRVSIGHAEERPKKALCPVCAVRGETKPEKVKADADYEGKGYYFCSDNCKKEFLLDPSAYMPAKLPRPAPPFVVETLDGRDVQSDFAGKITLVDFWATWCKPCEKIMPELQRLFEKYGDKGFQVLGISIDEDKDRVSRIKKYLKKHDISYPVFSDTKKVPAWHTYRVKAVPAMFLVDRSGQIVAEWRGTVDYELLVREVVRLVGEGSPADSESTSGF